MSTMDDLIDRIRETNDAIELSRANHEAIGLPSFVAKLEMNSLKQRLADLERQQREESVLNYEQLEVIFYTTDLPSGQIPVRTLMTVLGGIQSLTDSVANVLFNQPSNRGPIPQDILDTNSWILKAVKAGSFVAVLDLQHEGQLNFDEIPQRQTIKELFNLFQASDQEENLFDVISSLGTRTLRNYTEWSKNIRDLDTRIELSWLVSTGRSEKVIFDPERAQRIFTFLSEKLSYKEEEVSFEGWLTGVNVRTSAFELCSSEGDKVTGRIVKDSISKVVSHLDKKCVAQLVKVVTVSSAGIEKVSWTLNDISVREI